MSKDELTIRDKTICKFCGAIDSVVIVTKYNEDAFAISEHRYCMNCPYETRYGDETKNDS